MGDTTRKKNNLCLQDYKRDRETELNICKENGEVDSEATVAFPMLDMKKPNTVFFLKEREKRPVMVLMMNTRQDISETTVSKEPNERLKDQLMGQCVVLRENFERHGLLNVVTIRPRLSTKLMNASYFKADDNKKRETDANKELEKYKRRLCGEGLFQSATNHSVSSLSTSAPDLLVTGAHSVSPVVSPMSIASSHKRFALCSGTVTSPFPLRRVRSLSLDGRLKEEVSTIEGIFRDVRLTLSTSPVPGNDFEEGDEETHLDFSKTGDVSVEPNIFLPFVHYTMDEWVNTHDGSKQNYWRITKRANREYLQQRMTVVTSKQIREEDKRHLERLRSENSWKQRVAFFGEKWW